MSRVVIQRHEPFRFGWEPAELPGWLASRSCTLEIDHADDEVVRKYLDAVHEREFLSLRSAWRFHIVEATFGPERSGAGTRIAE